MDRQLEKVFLNEMDAQCNFALLAFEEMRGSLDRIEKRKIDTTEWDSEMRRFWARVQSLLAAVANISKILYPLPLNKKRTRGGDTARGGHRSKLIGDKLTEYFGDSSRSVRNCYEHLDEMIERNWWGKGRRLRIDYNVMPLDSFDPRDCFRNLDNAKDTLVFMTHSFHLKPMKTAIHDLREKIREEMKRP